LPTAHREKGFRFFFFSDDHEPSHVHVSKERWVARLEIASGKVIDSGGFPEHDLRDIQRILESHRLEIQRKWDNFVERKY
jgi:hypothetical protein